MHIKTKEQMVNVYIIACKPEPRLPLSCTSKNITTRGKMWFHHVNYITTFQRRYEDIFLNESKCEHASRQSLKRNRVTCSPRSQGLSPRAMVSTLCTKLRWDDKRLACKTHTPTHIIQASTSSSCSGIILCISRRKRLASSQLIFNDSRSLR